MDFARTRPTSFFNGEACMTVQTRRLRDRAEAGRLLAERLRTYAGRNDVIVLALPRGGVPVAFEIARALDAPLDVFLVRKLGVPGHEELAFGAIASGGMRVLNRQVVDALGLPPEQIAAIAAAEQRELERRERAYRGERPPPDVTGRTVILVDDGLATGSTMLAAVRALRQDDPARIVVAVPVADPEVCESLRAEADEVVCLFTPQPFVAVGVWYEDFSQTTDEEVIQLLEQLGGRHRRPPPLGSASSPARPRITTGSSSVAPPRATSSSARRHTGRMSSTGSGWRSQSV